MVSIKQHRGDFEKVVEHLQAELKTIRTGRANSALVERVMVEHYGALTPLQHVASVSIPDSRTIMISPWDKNALKEIEKGLVAAQLDVNPVNDGTVIRIVIPMMTEENRKNLIKTVGQKVEQSKIALRALRDKIKEQVIIQEKEKEITEDDRFSILEELDEATREFSALLDTTGETKSKEVMEI